MFTILTQFADHKRPLRHARLRDLGHGLVLIFAAATLAVVAPGAVQAKNKLSDIEKQYVVEIEPLEHYYNETLLTADERLRSPIDVSQRRRLFGYKFSGAFECPQVPQAIKFLEPPDYDRNRSGWFRKIRPLYYYLDMVVAMSDEYVLARPASGRIASCVLDWLHGWASKGAMVHGDPKNHAGKVERRWFSGTVAWAWLKIRDHDGLDDAKVKRVLQWFGNLAARSLKTHAEYNNHAYWEGLTAMLNGVALNQRVLFDFGVSRYRLAMAQMLPGGRLPREMKRGWRSLDYHNFALEPLVLMAEIAAANDVDLYGMQIEGNDIHALAKFVVDGVEDVDTYTKFSEYKQLLCFVCSVSLHWMEPYYARFKDPRMVTFLKRRRPFINRRVGGDQTIAYGVKKLPKEE